MDLSGWRFGGGTQKQGGTFDVLGGAPLQEQGLAHLRQHVAAVVAGGAVDAHAHVHAVVQQGPAPGF